MDLIQLFCNIDDFVKALDQQNNPSFVISKSKNKRGYPPVMSLSELMTIIFLYHSSGFKNSKSFYFYLLSSRKHDFPKLLSYSRFVE